MLFITIVAVALCLISRTAVASTSRKEFFRKVVDSFERAGARKETIAEYRKVHQLKAPSAVASEASDKKVAVAKTSEAAAAVVEQNEQKSSHIKSSPLASYRAKGVKKESTSKSLRSATYTYGWVWQTVYGTSVCTNPVWTEIQDVSSCIGLTSTSSESILFTSACDGYEVSTYPTSNCMGTPVVADYVVNVDGTCQSDTDDTLTSVLTYTEFGCSSAAIPTGISSTNLQGTEYGQSTTCSTEPWQFFYINAGCTVFGVNEGSYQVVTTTVASVDYYTLTSYTSTDCSGAVFETKLLADDVCTASSYDDDTFASANADAVQSNQWQMNPASTVAVNVALSAMLAAVAMFAL